MGMTGILSTRRLARAVVESRILTETRMGIVAKGSAVKISKIFRLLSSSKEKGFVDLRRVLVRGGKGGLGCYSFYNMGYKRKRRPDGGDGGRGGSVEFTADAQLGSLNHVPSTISGTSGGQGSSNNKLGANAHATIVKVPSGTVIYDTDGQILADLESEGEMFCAALGGAGGRGNGGGLKQTRAGSFEDLAKQGSLGQEKRSLVLELKTLADIGLVGMPNAGKSTFLRAVSHAHPRVAPYPFTTLNPHLGVVDFDDHWRMRIADIPGIIPGAHANKGLGHSFLRHIERNPVLLYIIDASNGSFSPVQAFEMLRDELGLYKAELLLRPFAVVANKMDCAGADQGLTALSHHLQGSCSIFPVCAQNGQGILAATSSLRRLVEKYSRPGENFSEQARKLQDMLFSPK